MKKYSPTIFFLGIWIDLKARKLTSEIVLGGCGPFIAIVCYQYAFSPNFEERKMFEMESGVSLSIYIPGATPNA